MHGLIGSLASRENTSDRFARFSSASADASRLVMGTAYFVAASGIGPDTLDFFAAFERLEQRLADHGVTFSSPMSRESEVQIVQTWPLEQHNGEVRIYDNAIVGVRHLELDADDEALLQLLVEQAVATLPVEDHTQLLRAWGEGRRDQPSTIVKIGLSAPSPLPDQVVEVISAGICDPSAAIRCMAAYCAALTADPRFEPVLDRQLAAEDDDNAADIMELALALLEPG